MLSIADIGSSAHQCLVQAGRAGQSGAIMAGFSRCCYIGLSPSEPVALSCLCIGQPDMLPGPVSLLFASVAQWRAFKRKALIGTQVSLYRDRLVLAGLSCDLSDANVSSNTLPVLQTRIAVGLMCERLDRLCQQAPLDSLAAILFVPHINRSAQRVPAVQRAFIEFIQPVCFAVGMALHSSLVLDNAAEESFAEKTAAQSLELTGAGSGLTPAGDDLLAGLLLGLHVCERGEHARQLIRVIRPELGIRTNRVSATLLQAAANGQAGDSMLSVLAQLSAADDIDYALLASLLDQQGHTSGWDCLAGFALLNKSLNLPTSNSLTPNSQILH